MKIVTYNVNGLRQRVSQHGSLLKLLSSLDADIICFQETKLQRQDLSVDVTMAEGYEAFLSCTRTSSKGRLGYSGVATFCRVSSAFSTKDVALPISVEEGFTGLLETSKREDNSARDFLIDKILDVEGLEDTTNEDLLKVDSEGRCIITDHGHFVIFNLYGPRADCDDKERTRFKFLFYKVLQRRWESLLSQGKRLVVVGDLNIAPTIIDRCDAEPEFEKNLFRTWLRSLLRECGGPFVDVFRSKHPGREGAYTCFSSRIGAEEFNYGSRIDHILIGGPCLHKSCGLDKHTLFDCHVIECDIMSQFIRGNFVSKPKWQGGRSIKLEGSDHVPVYAILDDIPDVLVHSTPSLAVRYVPEVRGWQQTIVPFLKKRRLSDTCEHPILSDNALGNDSDSAFTSLDNDKPLKCNKGLISTQLFLDPHQSSLQKLDHNSCNRICSEGNQPTSSGLDMEKKNYLHKMDSSVKKIRRAVYSQRTLRSFFHKPVPKLDSAVEEKALKGSLDLCDYNKSSDDLPYGTELIAIPSFLPAEDHLCGVHVSDVRLRHVDQDDTFSCCSSKTENKNTALLEWKRIQQKMKLSIPLCKGHGEPCVARSVKKEGTNNGRRFYCCARAQGPAANPEANCGHFEWATKRAKHKN